MSVSPELAAGAVLSVGSAVAYFWPSLKARFTSNKADYVPHKEAQTLVAYFVAKGCKNGTDMARGAGKALYDAGLTLDETK